MKKNGLVILFFFLSLVTLSAHQNIDSAKRTWTSHFQITVISQKHSGFNAAYTGAKSLADSVEPAATSLTSTLFLGKRLWKHAAFYFNPEVSGGNGLSYATGVAGALNGETYRVGTAAPQVFIARCYFKQLIPLKNTTYEAIGEGVNQVAASIPAKRLVINVGKFSIADFYDDNAYSKDPRSQFFNWSLWANGAWDYPANTRGYTFGGVFELIEPNWGFRISSVAVPDISNFHTMEYNINHSHCEALEITHQFKALKHKGNVRFITSYAHSRAPSYVDGIKAIADNNSFLLNVFQGNEKNTQFGGKKTCIGLNYDQAITNDLGVFSRVGWNDGKYATWAFTEIDRTLSLGLTTKGNKWKRANDVFGLATVVNGLSDDHKNYLQNGGYGFIVGDGQLNYSHEAVVETFYNAYIENNFWVTLDYQFVNNPGYNKDRGPVHVFSIRVHIEK